MNSSTDNLMDAGLELCEAKSFLVSAQGCSPDNANQFRKLALESLSAARRRIEAATIRIEKELYEPERV